MGEDDPPARPCRVKAKALHEAYSAWCDEAGGAQWKASGLNAAMIDKGFPPVARGDAPLALWVCELAKELVDVSARISEALADVAVQPREAAAAEAEVDDLIERAVCLRAELQRLQGAGVVSIPVREGRAA